jgi:hypothetical protein
VVNCCDAGQGLFARRPGAAQCRRFLAHQGNPDAYLPNLAMARRAKIIAVRPCWPNALPVIAKAITDARQYG